MKLSQFALAAVSLAVAAQAQAVVRITGATATSNNYIRVLYNLCPSNDISVYKNTAATNNLGNNFTVKCNSGDFGTSGENEARFDITGGSINSVVFSQYAFDLGEPRAILPNVGGKFITAAGAGCAAAPVTGTGVLAFLGSTRLFTGCTIPATVEKSDGGFSDVEPAVFKATGVLANDYLGETTAGSFSQVFGVAVNKTLYEALQTAQGLTVGATDPANQPTVSRAKFASIMNNNDFNDAKRLGPRFLVPGTAVTKMAYCRRPDTSGTQASAQLYFMMNPVASGTLGGQLGIHAPNTDGGATVTVNASGFPGASTDFIMNSGSSNVRNCLNDLTGYRFGILSAENNPIGSSDTYRFVKISNVSMTAGVAGDTQTATALTGDFDFVYEAALFNPNFVPLLDEMNTAMPTGTFSPGLFLNSNSATPETKFSRPGGSTGTYTSR